MKKIKIPARKANRLLNHGPLTLISCFVAEGQYNCMPAAWIMPVSHEPPHIATVIGKGNYTHKWIREHKEFAVNIPPKTILKEVLECGGVTGSEVNKFERFKFTPEPAEAIKAPLIKECIGHLECQLVEDTSTIDNFNLFIAQVKVVWVEEEAFDEVWKLEKEEYTTFHHLGGNSFVLDGEVKKIL